MYEIDIIDRQSAKPVDESRLHQAVHCILEHEGISEAVISVAIVNDAEIHELNRQYLNHDYETDVLSFVLSEFDGMLEGEVIVSMDTAIRECQEFGWPAENELLLYVVHGTLHLVGYNDKCDEDRLVMRQKERDYLSRLGIQPPTQSSS